jgi:DNA-binding response OmpR family regulator
LPAPSDAGPAKCVLVADDDYHERELISGILVQSGYKVDTANDGLDAWNMLDGDDYDLLISDNQMPRMSGMELIRKLHAEKNTVPIILISGAMPLEELKRHPELRIDAVLSKPFTITGLLDAVKKVLPLEAGTAVNFPVFAQHELAGGETLSAKTPVTALTAGRTNLSHRILVVDDDEDIRRLSVDVLVGSGYDAEGVTDGVAGWEALQNYDFDLVITDNKMPRMTGLEMIEKLRSARMMLPVVMATRFLPTHEFIRRPWLKPDATLERPFSNEALLATVNKILRPDGGDEGRPATLLPDYL